MPAGSNPITIDADIVRGKEIKSIEVNCKIEYYVSGTPKEFAMAIAEAEYFEQRLDDQINWYDKKSAFNQAWYKR